MAKRRQNKTFRPFPDDELCPCDSGLTYRKCCKRKKFRFEIDERGRVHKQIKIHPRLKPVLDEAQTEFRKVFGRKPGYGDPVIFNQHLTNDEEFWQHAQTAGRAAGVREELIFAWRRSGFIVGKHSRQLMPENEYEEWTDAIDEYFFLKEEGFDPFYVFTYLSGEEYEHYKNLVSKLDHAIIAVGFATTKPKSLKNSADYFRYLFLQRVLRSLRTIREMYNTRYDDDCLAIARGVYEAYLRMKFLRLDPTGAERLQALLAYEVGAYQTKINKDGRPQYGICVDPKTGQEFKTTISNREILKISDFPLEEPLYYDLYPLLSGFVHPDLTQEALKSISAKRADIPRSGDAIRSIILISTVAILLLLETSTCSFCRKKTKRDVVHVVKNLSKNLLALITSDTVVRHMIVPQSIYNFETASAEPKQPG
jgi:hypothetical protein